MSTCPPSVESICCEAEGRGGRKAGWRETGESKATAELRGADMAGKRIASSCLAAAVAASSGTSPVLKKLAGNCRLQSPPLAPRSLFSPSVNPSNLIGGFSVCCLCSVPLQFVSFMLC